MNSLVTDCSKDGWLDWLSLKQQNKQKKTKSSFFQRKGIGLRQVLALWIRIPNSLMHIVGFSDV